MDKKPYSSGSDFDLSKLREKWIDIDNKKIWFYGEVYVKEFIRKIDKFLIKKYAEEKTTHKNHRVQSLLVELRQKLHELAGDELK